MKEAIETVATRIAVENIDGFVTLDVTVLDPDTRTTVGAGTLSCLNKTKALQLAQMLTKAAKNLEQEDLPDLGDPSQP